MGRSLKTISRLAPDRECGSEKMKDLSAEDALKCRAAGSATCKHVAASFALPDQATSGSETEKLRFKTKVLYHGAELAAYLSNGDCSTHRGELLSWPCDLEKRGGTQGGSVSMPAHE